MLCGEDFYLNYLTIAVSAHIFSPAPASGNSTAKLC